MAAGRSPQPLLDARPPVCRSGNILEDSALLASLAQTKAKAATAAAALEEGARLAGALDAERDGAGPAERTLIARLNAPL